MASLKNKLFAGKTFLWMRKNRKPLCIAVACLLAALLVFAFPIKQEDAPDFVFDEYTNVSKICELSTLRCYYHNVAEFKNNRKGCFSMDWLRATAIKSCGWSTAERLKSESMQMKCW